ncbi:hypothetical protein [Bifidobacterium aerophilum]|uniref:hypothetical protein n=1 Tax=Bifidobacterium aerophilum TaxID=1798155 RepID=UPI0013D76538|nr:hypothetical protein [Bifidobacterium aerophilum]
MDYSSPTIEVRFNIVGVRLSALLSPVDADNQRYADVLGVQRATRTGTMREIVHIGCVLNGNRHYVQVIVTSART